MYVVVQHTFTNQAVAQTRGERLIRNEGAPDGAKGLQFYLAADGSQAMCLWEADSAEDIQRYVDETLGDSSTNAVYEVNAEASFARHPLGISEKPALV